jgi:SHS2 domain-containing protein
MGRSETFDHTADLGLRILATDLSDLFRTAGEGLFDIIVSNRQNVVGAEAEPVEIDAETTEDLLIAWLSELIFRVETRHRLYSEFDIEIDESGRRLKGRILGEPIDRNRHALDHEVKAVTRHGLILRRDKIDGQGWLAEVILDI